MQIFTSSGSLDASGDYNAANLKWDKNNPEVTTFGKTTTQRISGIRDYSLDIAGIFNSGASTPFSYLATDFNGSLLTLFKLAPGGSVSGCPVFSGCAVLSAFNVNGPQNGPIAMTMTLQAGAGSLTAACIP